jgi:hypothetical protein
MAKAGIKDARISFFPIIAVKALERSIPMAKKSPKKVLWREKWR